MELKMIHDLQSHCFLIFLKQPDDFVFSDFLLKVRNFLVLTQVLFLNPLNVDLLKP